MCKGSNTTTTQQTPDPNAYSAYNSLLQRAAGVGNLPYTAYSGELVAPINQQQQAGIGNINANWNEAQPYINQAAGYATAAAAPITGSQINQYLNPYTQDVVQATEAQFAQQNAMQQSQLTGNAAAQGALGGDRVGVAQGTLAGQQQLAEAPTIAGLEQSGYNTALQEANTEQQAMANAAYSVGNLGVSGQNAALQGAGAQFGAGTAEQQTQQALDQALYGQFQLAQAFPYQQTQWLAGVDTGVGSQMGGTSSTTGPPPSWLAQGLGLGILGMGMFSDERLKEDISKVGHTNDGQPIYRFRYKGDPKWQIGLMAQEVEKRHPEAVHKVSGLGMVDYKAATDDAVHERRRGGIIPGYDMGGGVDVGGEFGAGVGATPWASAQGYIPGMGITPGKGPPAPPQAHQDTSNSDLLKLETGLIGKNKGSLSGLFGSSGDSGGITTGGDAAGVPGLDLATAFDSRGGGISGYADGGDVDSFSDRFAPVMGIGHRMDPNDFDPIDDRRGKTFQESMFEPGAYERKPRSHSLHRSGLTADAGYHDIGRHRPMMAGFGTGGFVRHFADGGADTSIDDVPTWALPPVSDAPGIAPSAALQGRAADFAAGDVVGDTRNGSAGYWQPSYPRDLETTPSMGAGIGTSSADAQHAATYSLNNLEQQPGPPQYGPPAPTAEQAAASQQAGIDATPVHATHGSNLTTIETNGGHRATVSSAAAPYFRGFLNDLEAAGAPIKDIGSFNDRNIAGTNTKSQHAFGNAIDIDQSGRNVVSPAFQKWADANKDVIDSAASKWGMVNGGSWKNPDFGHFEWSGRSDFQPTSGGSSQTAGIGNISTDTNTSSSQKSGLFGFNPLGLSDNARSALMAAGLGMMASRSPFPGVAIGEGGLKGLSSYAQSQQQALSTKKTEADIENARKRLDLQAKQAQAQIDHWNKQLQLQQETGKFSAPVAGTGQNEKGETVSGAYVTDMKTGQPTFHPGMVLTGKGGASTLQLPPEAWTKNGDEFLKYLPPDRQQLIKGMAKYEIDPKSSSVTGGHREENMGLTKQFDPSFDQKTYNTRYNAINRFATGPQGNTVRSLNVAIDHLQTLDDLGTALNNGNVQTGNAILNRFQQEFGDPRITNFGLAKNIVADEVLKAVIGSGAGTMQDREELQRQFAAANSPAQMKGVIATAQSLMAGQMRGLEQQYKGATGMNDFQDRYLSPPTRQRLQAASHPMESTAGAAGAGPVQVKTPADAQALPPGTRYVTPDGKVYTR